MMSIEDKATAYVLGSLSHGERETITRERLYDSRLDEEIKSSELLFEGLQQKTQGASADDTLWSRISDALNREEQTLQHVKIEECTSGGWGYHGPGIEFKPLWSDKTILIRCNPGAVEEAHDQPADEDEHILIIAGDIDIGGRVFGTGDYICIPAGSVHQRMSTENGCLLFTEYKAKV